MYSSLYYIKYETHLTCFVHRCCYLCESCAVITMFPLYVYDIHVLYWECFLILRLPCMSGVIPCFVCLHSLLAGVLPTMYFILGDPLPHESLTAFLNPIHFITSCHQHQSCIAGYASHNVCPQNHNRKPDKDILTFFTFSDSGS